jgi:hypothetical protein
MKVNCCRITIVSHKNHYPPTRLCSQFICCQRQYLSLVCILIIRDYTQLSRIIIVIACSYKACFIDSSRWDHLTIWCILTQKTLTLNHSKNSDIESLKKTLTSTHVFTGFEIIGWSREIDVHHCTIESSPYISWMSPKKWYLKGKWSILDETMMRQWVYVKDFILLPLFVRLMICCFCFCWFWGFLLPSENKTCDAYPNGSDPVEKSSWPDSRIKAKSCPTEATYDYAYYRRFIECKVARYIFAVFPFIWATFLFVLSSTLHQAKRHKSKGLERRRE